jgi:hypothetical protein
MEGTDHASVVGTTGQDANGDLFKARKNRFPAFF